MMISLMDQAIVTEFENYHPAHIIRVVNALQPLGKEEALQRIESYIESRDSGRDLYGLFWVLRVLFDVPAEQGFPPVRIGRPSIPPPAEPGHLPRFPIVIVRDIPFLAVRGYDLAGLPEPVEVHVAYFRAYGTLREQPLAPPASMDGVEEEFLQLWKAAYGDAHIPEALGAVRAQVARLRG